MPNKSDQNRYRKSCFENRINHDARAFERVSGIWLQQNDLTCYSNPYTRQHTHIKWWPISSDQNRVHLAINLRSLSYVRARTHARTYTRDKKISENRSIYTVYWTPIWTHDKFNFHAETIIILLFIQRNVFVVANPCTLGWTKTKRWKSMKLKENQRQSNWHDTFKKILIFVY